MSIEAMKRIKSLLQDGDKIDSHTISAVVAECDAAILTQRPAAPEPVLTTPNFTQLMQILDGLNRCHSRDSKVEFLRSWIRDWTQHKVDKLTHPAPSVPDDVVRDAERWRTFLATRPSNTHEVVNAAIDAAMLAAK